MSTSPPWGRGGAPGNLSALFAGGFTAAAVAPDEPPELVFRGVLERAGLTVDPVVGDGALHRCRSPGDKGTEKSGWYVLFLDHVPSGAYGDWRSGETGSWCARAEHELDVSERETLRTRVTGARQKRDAETERRHQAAERRAQQLLEVSMPAPPDHPYLARKGVKPHGLTVDDQGRLLIPMADETGIVRSVQIIDQDGTKRFLTGGRTRGCFHRLGQPDGLLYVAEGFATAATVHEVTGRSVVVAFSAANLQSVTRSLRATYPTIRIVIAADNDRFVAGNPGVTQAQAAARGTGAEVIYPTFATDQGTDWNDCLAQEGIDRVREQLGATASRFRLVSLRELILEPKRPEWLVRGLEERNVLSVTYGQPGAAKSFYELDKSLSVAHGVDFHGRPVRRGPVVYVAGEGHGGLSRRLLAWTLRYGTGEIDVPFYVTPHRVLLMQPKEAYQLHEAMKGIADQHGRVDKIVVDTLARNMGGDENSTQDMNAFVDALDYYLRVPFGAHVAVVHHTGHAETDRMRGNRALEGAVDAATLVYRDVDGSVIAEPRRLKDGELPGALRFRLEAVELPLVDEEGQALTSAVLVPEGTLQGAEQVHADLRPQERRALDWLRGKYVEIGARLKDQGRDPFEGRVEWVAWKRATREAGIWKGSHANFSRLARQLQEAGLVIREGAHVVLGSGHKAPNSC